MTRFRSWWVALVAPAATCAAASGSAARASAHDNGDAFADAGARDASFVGARDASLQAGARDANMPARDAHASIAAELGTTASASAHDGGADRVRGERRSAVPPGGRSTLPGAADLPPGEHASDKHDEHLARAPCPADMVLVDGDYCDALEATCLHSTYAPQNQKTICWDFKEPTVCSGHKTHKRYCIDRYEYPNRRGARPRVMVNFPQAQTLCADEGKRVCTETEWTTACEGPDYKPYPYGYHRDPTICRGDQPYPFPDLKKAFSSDRQIAKRELARTYDAVRSGSQPRCVSDYGVYDMPGNADELAASETPPPRSPSDNVTTGGPWLEGVRNQCRPKIYTHNEGFAYYYLSFRCCAEPDGQPTDPRSPKQITREEKWRRVAVPPELWPPAEP